MTTPGKLRLDEQLCFALYTATNAITRNYRPQLKEIGLTYPQYLAMIVLWQDGESQTHHLADRLYLAPNAITPLMDKLEEKGFVQRRRDVNDRRVVFVSVTEEGAELEAKAAAVWDNVACQTNMTMDELQAFRRELLILADRMDTSDCSITTAAAE